MKNNNITHACSAVMFAAVLLAPGLSVNAADNAMNVGGIQLCGSFTDAVALLKKKGFFQGYQQARLDHLVKSGRVPAMKRDQQGHIKYFVQGMKGKVVQVSYDTRQYASAASEAAQAKEMAAKVTGSSPNCMGSPQSGVENCNYARGATQISVRMVKSLESVRVFAKSNCK